MEIGVYTVRETAEILKVSEKTVYKMIRSNELTCIWVRGQIRITRTALDNFLQGGIKGGEKTSRESV